MNTATIDGETYYLVPKTGPVSLEEWMDGFTERYKPALTALGNTEKKQITDVPQEKSQQRPETDLSGAVKNTGTAIDEILDTECDITTGEKLRKLIDKQVREARVGLAKVTKTPCRDIDGNKMTQYTIVYTDGSGEFVRVPTQAEDRHE